MSGSCSTPDDSDGMQVTTAPMPERGRAEARLLAHLEALDRADPVRPSAADRLDEALGPELARKLVFALAPSVDRRCAIAAA
jgi:hypothetical protein